MDDLYREIILDHYKHPRNFGSLKNPDASAEKDNPVCGDSIKMELKIENGKLKVIDINFSGQGCAISMASSSMLTEKVNGMKINSLLKISKDDIVEMLGTELTPARVKCAILPLEVIHKAVKTYGKKE